MKKVIYIALLLLLWGCEESKIDAESYGMIYGLIVDGADYTPLSGVMIVTNPASIATITDSSGTFSIAKVIEGEVAITAKKDDYTSNSVSVAVYGGDTTNISLFLLEDNGDVGWVDIYDPVPGNGAVDQGISFTMQWSVDQQYTGYDLEYTVYYYESNSTTQYTAGENLTETEVIVANLEYSKTYYWYVVAKYEGERVAYSPTWTFRTSSD